MRRRHVHREVDEFLDLVFQVVVLERDGGEMEIRIQVLAVHSKNALPLGSPGLADLNELILDLLLPGGERHVQS